MKPSWMLAAALACTACDDASPDLTKTKAPVQLELPAPLPDADERHAVVVLRFDEKGAELVSTRIGVGAAPAPRDEGPLRLTMLDRKGVELGRAYLDDPRDVRAYGGDPKSSSIDPVVRMSNVEATLSLPLSPGFDRLDLRSTRGKMQLTFLVGESLRKACDLDGSDVCRRFAKYD